MTDNSGGRRTERRPPPALSALLDVTGADGESRSGLQYFREAGTLVPHSLLSFQPTTRPFSTRTRKP